MSVRSGSVNTKLTLNKSDALYPHRSELLPAPDGGWRKSLSGCLMSYYCTSTVTKTVASTVCIRP